MKNVIIFFYFIFLLLFIIFSYLFIDPGLFYLHVLFTNFFQNHRIATTLIFSASIVIFFLFYSYFLYKAIKQQVEKKQLVILIVGSFVFLLFAYPAMLSFDIFNYIATAKVMYFYHENPYILMPAEFVKDPLLLFMHAANKTALYAPFWLIMTGLPYILGFGIFLLILFNFKLFVGIFYLATALLIWKMTHDKIKVIFFALNPLVLLESLLSSHNDIVMAFLLLLSIYFIFHKHKAASYGLLVLSIGIKYVTAILVPLFVIVAIKQISKQKLFTWISVCMYVIFFLSSFREEIYPWYTIWFLLPVTFLIGDNLISWVSITFTFSMLLRYIPFMLLGTYFGPTPFLKIMLMSIPIGISILFYFLHKKKLLL